MAVPNPFGGGAAQRTIAAGDGECQQNPGRAGKRAPRPGRVAAEGDSRRIRAGTRHLQGAGSRGPAPCAAASRIRPEFQRVRRRGVRRPLRTRRADRVRRSLLHHDCPRGARRATRAGRHLRASEGDPRRVRAGRRPVRRASSPGSRPTSRERIRLRERGAVHAWNRADADRPAAHPATTRRRQIRRGFMSVPWRGGMWRCAALHRQSPRLEGSNRECPGKHLGCPYVCSSHGVRGAVAVGAGHRKEPAIRHDGLLRERARAGTFHDRKNLPAGSRRHPAEGEGHPRGQGWDESGWGLAAGSLGRVAAGWGNRPCV